MLSTIRRMWARKSGSKNARTTRRQVGSGFESLETRQMCAVSVTHAGGVNTVQGDGADNRVLVANHTGPSGQAMLRVSSENGTFTDVPRGTLLRVMLGNGHDVLSAAGISVPVHVWSGPGNDDVTTGSGNDIVNLDGGNDKAQTNGGADILRGGNGNDHLIGGAGKDYFNGHAGADIIDMRDGNATLTGDRNRDPQSIDTVRRDPLANVPGSAVIKNHTTNEVHFTGTSVQMLSGPPGDVFEARVNTQSKGQWRAGVGVVLVTAYNFSIDADVREDAMRSGLYFDQLG